MNTRSKTTGAPPASYETRSDSNAGSPARQPRSRASRRPSRTAETVSLARVMTRPSLNSRTWCSGVSARSARITSSPSGGGRNERCRLIGCASTSLSRSSTSTRGRPVRRSEPRAEQPRRDVLALGREIAGEAAELEDVVVDRRGGDERAEPVAARDEVLALEELERLA